MESKWAGKALEQGRVTPDMKWIDIKIKDLKSQKKILSGIFVVWISIFFSTIIVSRNEILFLIITFITSVLIFLNLLSLSEQIKEERNTLTEKEIYLLQQLAKKK